MAARTGGGNTPVRNLRLDDETWNRVVAIAASQDVTASDFVRNAIDDRIARYDAATTA